MSRHNKDDAKNYVNTTKIKKKLTNKEISPPGPLPHHINPGPVTQHFTNHMEFTFFNFYDSWCVGVKIENTVLFLVHRIGDLLHYNSSFRIFWISDRMNPLDCSLSRGGQLLMTKAEVLCSIRCHTQMHVCVLHS